ncbi:MAG: hypothetical protein ABI723_23850 [Bacteroidia bacterium]
MAHTKLPLTLLIAMTIVFCQAQQDSIYHTDTSQNHAPSYSLNVFSSHSQFSFRSYSSFKHYLNKTDPFSIPKLSLNTYQPQQDFFRPIFTPYLNQANYNSLMKPDLYYGYNPANPTGANTVGGSLIFGSLDYLLWKLFPDK